MNASGGAGFSNLSDGMAQQALRAGNLDDAAVPALKRATMRRRSRTMFVVDPDTVEAIIFGEVPIPKRQAAASGKS